MDPQTAQYTLAGLTVVLMAVWSTAMVFTVRTAARAMRIDAVESEVEIPADPSVGFVSTRVEIEGEPEDLARRAARCLAQGKGGVPVRLIDVSRDQVIFDAPLEVGGNGVIKQGKVRYTPAGLGRSEADCVVAYHLPPPWLLRAAKGFLFLGMTAIGGAFLLIDQFVVSNPNPHVRYQVVQVLQAIHLVWPPFLFAGIFRGQIRMREFLARQLADGLTHNLPYRE